MPCAAGAGAIAIGAAEADAAAREADQLARSASTRDCWAGERAETLSSVWRGRRCGGVVGDGANCRAGDVGEFGYAKAPARRQDRMSKRWDSILFGMGAERRSRNRNVRSEEQYWGRKVV